MVLKGTPDCPAGREDAERLCRDSVLKSPALTSNLRTGPGAHVHTGFFSGMSGPRFVRFIRSRQMLTHRLRGGERQAFASPIGSGRKRQSEHAAGLKGSSEQLPMGK